MSFQGQTVLVTGASMGIGAAIAEAFAAEGANLVLAARSQALLEQVAARLQGRGGRVVTVPVDITAPDDVTRLTEAALAVTGRVDVLVNNAGVGMNGAIETLDLDAWRRCLELNVIAPVRLIQALLPAMKAAGGGSIVQISSVLGKVSLPYTAGYNASKYALNAVSEALRLEVSPFGIQVISVYPGSTESNFRSNSLGQSAIPKVRFKRRVPAAQVGRRVVAAVAAGERDVYVTARDALLCGGANLWPRLTDRVLKLAYRNHGRQA